MNFNLRSVPLVVAAISFLASMFLLQPARAQPTPCANVFTSVDDEGFVYGENASAPLTAFSPKPEYLGRQVCHIANTGLGSPLQFSADAQCEKWQPSLDSHILFHNGLRYCVLNYTNQSAMKAVLTTGPHNRDISLEEQFPGPNKSIESDAYSNKKNCLFAPNLLQVDGNSGELIWKNNTGFRRVKTCELDPFPKASGNAISDSKCDSYGPNSVKLNLYRKNDTARLLRRYCVSYGAHWERLGTTAFLLSNQDVDGDGFDVSVDCDDENELINPKAPESVANGIDNDCDGEIDEDVTTLLETEFNLDDWDSVLCPEIPLANDDNDFSTYQNAAFGDPAPSFGVNHTYSRRIAVCHVRKNFQAPLSSASIESLSFELQARVLRGGMAVVPLVKQGDTYYWAIWRGFSRSFQSRAQPFVESDFVQVYQDEATAKHPDFSCEADPIEFGFVTANQQGASGVITSREANIDNWSVTIARGNDC